MKPLFLLVLLSQNGAGDINASFVTTQSKESCEQKGLVVEGIFTSARIPILDKRCVQTQVQFTPFDHDDNTAGKRHFYLIKPNHETLEITPMADWKTCFQAQKDARQSTPVYCASSRQKLLSDQRKDR